MEVTASSTDVQEESSSGFFGQVNQMFDRAAARTNHARGVLSQIRACDNIICF
jgi:glutamate dehydrogenase (NAD(P)+)